MYRRRELVYKSGGLVFLGRLDRHGAAGGLQQLGEPQAQANLILRRQAAALNQLI
jgi:hypothetical protein